MSRLWALALNTFREAVRDRVLYSILLFALGVLMLSLVMQELTIGDQDKVVRSVAQGAIDVFGSIIAMFLGVSLVWKELDRRTAYTVLAKPLPRWMFIIGKYLGLVLTLAAELALLAVAYSLLMLTQQGFPPPVFFASVGMLLAQLMLLTAWATLFSTISAPTTAAGFTLAIYVIGHLADDIWVFGSQAASEGVRQVAHVLYWALPNLELFNIRPQAVHGDAIPWDQMGPALLYGAAYATIVLSVAVAAFQRKDLK